MLSGSPFMTRFFFFFLIIPLSILLLWAPHFPPLYFFLSPPSCLRFLFPFLSFHPFLRKNKTGEQTTASSCLVDESTTVDDSVQCAKRQEKQIPVRL